MLKTISIRVSGKVQGVFYRQTCKEFANELGVTGSVRNLADDTVEIFATGSEDQLKQLLDWSKKGPPAAAVQNIKVNDLQLQQFDRFKVER
jgi:acylphosphatase